MRSGRPGVVLAVGAMVLAACGSTASESPVAQRLADDETAPSAATAPATTDASTTDPPTATEAPAATGAPATSEAPAATDAPAAGDTAEPAATQPPATDPPATDPPASTAPPGPVWPDDGCSADNSPTPTDVAAGPAPELEIRTASAASPLPDLAVRRINCNGGWVNLKNELPADRALLVWFWAPH